MLMFVELFIEPFNFFFNINLVVKVNFQSMVIQMGQKKLLFEITGVIHGFSQGF